MNIEIFQPTIFCEIKPRSIPLERSIVVATNNRKEEPKRQEKRERDSTKEKKEMFLDFLEKTRGMISVVCLRTNVSRSTYYNWRNTDQSFKEQADEIIDAKPEILEDIMYKKAIGGEFGPLKFMLMSLHDKYKKSNNVTRKSVVDIFHHVDNKDAPPKITAEDMVDNPELFAVYMDWKKKHPDY